MKKGMFSLLLMAGLLIGLTGMTGCSDSSSSGGQKSGGTVVDDKSGPEYTSVWICPMHCEGSGSEEPGQCPVCGMDYVKNPDHPDNQSGTSSHDHGEGEDHDHMDGDDHDHDHGDHDHEH